MPAYIANPQISQVHTLYKGDTIALVAPGDAGVTQSLECAIGPEPGVSNVTVMIANTTNQPAQAVWTAQEQFAGSSSVPTYIPIGGAQVVSNSTYQVQLSGGWLSFTFATAPTTGSLSVSR